jgi:hypothetical protein
MAVCAWCQGEMETAISCVVDVLHKKGRRFPLPCFGGGSKQRSTGDRCGDCGVLRGGWHHPGCDLQRCPACRHQLISCGCRFDEDAPSVNLPLVEPLGVDGNGLLTGRMWLGEQEVIVHFDDLPESDVTTVDGIRCTTALRTIIDVAPELEPEGLEEMVRDALARGLFTVDEAWLRLDEPDMIERPGARLLGRVLPLES